MMAIEQFLNSKFVERLRRNLALKTGIYCRLKKLSASASEEMRMAKLLNHFEIDWVIDVGANTGQFAESLFDFGYKGKVVSFEPVSKVHAQLQERGKNNPRWIMAEKCALGNESKTLEINVSRNSVFSSVLDINEDYVLKAARAQTLYKEQVQLHRLDDIIENYLVEKAGNIFLKIDTQGFEKEVLDGALVTLRRSKGIKIEIPLFPIYENVHWGFDDIIDFMRKENFYPYGFSPVGIDHATGRANTIDGVFFRDK